MTFKVKSLLMTSMLIIIEAMSFTYSISPVPYICSKVGGKRITK
jgi:hypothetical protein